MSEGLDPGPMDPDLMDAVRKGVVELGFTVVTTSTTLGSIHYTVGLWPMLPELLIALPVLNDDARQAFAAVRNKYLNLGRLPGSGEQVRFNGGCVAFRRLHPEIFLPMALLLRTYHGSNVPVFQIVMQDLQGHWPWEPGIDPEFAGQELEAYTDLQGTRH